MNVNLKIFLEVSANWKMRSMQLVLIKLRNTPSTSPKSAGKRWPQPLFSHQPWTPEKKKKITKISYCLNLETKSRKYLQSSVQKSQCKPFSTFIQYKTGSLSILWTSSTDQILPSTLFSPLAGISLTQRELLCPASGSELSYLDIREENQVENSGMQDNPCNLHFLITFT